MPRLQGAFEPMSCDFARGSSRVVDGMPVGSDCDPKIALIEKPPARTVSPDATAAALGRCRAPAVDSGKCDLEIAPGSLATSSSEECAGRAIALNPVPYPSNGLFVPPIHAMRELLSKRHLPWLAACWLVLLSPTASAVDRGTIAGAVKVLDGDTIEIQDVRVRLHGIDAPERDQTCRDSRGRGYRCGERAAAALSGRVAGSAVRCVPRDRDDYGRIVAVCHVGTESLNAWMVEQGWALAYRHYSRDYVSAEDAARKSSRGLWSGSFEKPWKYRHARKRAAPPATSAQGAESRSSDCAIKGNVNGRGERIYHVPGQQHYRETRIDPARGERWFCSETEARASGWRRARE